MASYYYTCANCKQSIKGQYKGNSRDAERYAKHLESQGRECSECWQKEQEIRNKEAAADPLNAQLPQLIGTEKQIEWAIRLRLEAQPVIDGALNEVLATFRERQARLNISAQALNELVDAAHLVCIELKETTEASEWIDWRSDSQSNWATRIKKTIEKNVRELCPTFVAENKPKGK